MAPGSTASNLLELVKANDGPAWQRLAALYTPLVYSWARRSGLQSEDAADVAQDVFQAVHKHIAGFEHGQRSGSFRAWLWTIARNKLNDHWRRHRRQPQAAGGTEAQARLLQTPELDLDSPAEPGDCYGNVLRRALEMIRDEFEERSWQAFWKVTIEDRVPADTAAELGMSVNSVYIVRSRVLARLRQILGDEMLDASRGRECP